MQKPSPSHRLLTLAALLAALPAAAAPDITDLGTLKNDNSEYSQANAVNSDGSLVVGGALNNNLESRATIWSGSNWGTKTDLGTLKADNSGNSAASALSRDGSVVVGSSSNDNDSANHATVWSGSGWGIKTDLGTLKGDNSGGSEAQAVSSDGTVVVGQAIDDNNEIRATVWSGSGWGIKTDLGTLKTDNTSGSSARAVSSNGSVIVGEAVNDNDEQRATV